MRSTHSDAVGRLLSDLGTLEHRESEQSSSYVERHENAMRSTHSDAVGLLLGDLEHEHVVHQE